MARLVCSSPHLTALATLHLSPSRLPLSQSSLALTAETLAGYAFLSVLSAPIPLGSWEGLFTGPRASHTHLTSTPHEPNSPVYRSSDPPSLQQPRCSWTSLRRRCQLRPPWWRQKGHMRSAARPHHTDHVRSTAFITSAAARTLLSACVALVGRCRAVYVCVLSRMSIEPAYTYVAAFLRERDGARVRRGGCATGRA